MNEDRLEALWAGGKITARHMRIGRAFAEDFRMSRRTLAAADMLMPKGAVGVHPGSFGAPQARRRCDQVKLLLEQPTWRVVVEIAVRDESMAEVGRLVEATPDRVVGMLTGGLDAMGARVYAM